MSADYADQTEGMNQFGVPYIAGQCVENAVRGESWTDQCISTDQDNITGGVVGGTDLMKALGFSSVEEMIAAAARM